MARVIAICNNKGGVGKTNVGYNLPPFLARLGQRVLLIDFDHQANATYSLGLSEESLPLSVYHALIGKVSPMALIRNTAFFGYDLIPSSPELAGAEIELVSLPDREIKLRSLVKQLEDKYDFIFIDSPPSLGLLTINILCAAREILIPVQSEYLALEGLGQLLNTIELVRKNLGHQVEITGAVLTMHNRRSRICREVEKQLRQEFPGYVFNTFIPRATVLAEAPRFGQTILQYAPESKAAKAYEELAKELISLTNRQQSVANQQPEKSGQQSNNVDQLPTTNKLHTDN